MIASALPLPLQSSASGGYRMGVPGSPSAFIRKLMSERLLRPVDVEELTGLSRATVDRNIGGDKEPNFEQRSRYAKAFGMTPAEFEAGWQHVTVTEYPPAGRRQRSEPDPIIPGMDEATLTAMRAQAKAEKITFAQYVTNLFASRHGSVTRKGNGGSQSKSA